MAKQVFIAGGITAEDWSFLKAMAQGLAKHPDRDKLWTEPPPEGLLERLEAEPVYMPSSAELLVAEKQARIEDLEAEKAARG